MRALRLLGPLEGRILGLAWDGRLPATFTVRDVHGHLGDLAYTTVMTTVARLADKGLLSTEATSRGRAYVYRVAMDPATFVRRSTEAQVDELIARFGDVALASFASRLNTRSRPRRGRPRSSKS